MASYCVSGQTQEYLGFAEYLIYQKGLSQNTVNSYVSDLKKLSYSSFI